MFNVFIAFKNMAGNNYNELVLRCVRESHNQAYECMRGFLNGEQLILAAIHPALFRGTLFWAVTMSPLHLNGNNCIGYIECDSV